MHLMETKEGIVSMWSITGTLKSFMFEYLTSKVGIIKLVGVKSYTTFWWIFHILLEYFISSWTCTGSERAVLPRSYFYEHLISLTTKRQLSFEYHFQVFQYKQNFKTKLIACPFYYNINYAKLLIFSFFYAPTKWYLVEIWKER